MPIDYLPIFVLVIVSIGFACLALIVPTLLGPRRPTETKLLPYESGEINFGNARRRFLVEYYLTAMLFIVLDIAVILCIRGRRYLEA